MEEITSRKNALLVHIKKLQSSARYRRESGDYLADGSKLFADACACGAPIHTVVTHDKGLQVPEGVRAVWVPSDVFESISPMKSPQGVLFLGECPQYATPNQLPRGKYLVLDGVQDAGNVGTLWRTANGLGCDGLILLSGCADPWGHKTVRASMGACYRLPVYQMEAEQLIILAKNSQIPLYATALNPESCEIAQVDLSACMVVLGSEGQGVSPQVLSASQKQIYLPMARGCESLNVAVAGGIILWEMMK